MARASARKKASSPQRTRPDLKLVGEAASPSGDVDLSEVEEFAETLPDKWLLCRRLGHNWTPYTASVNYRTKAIYEVLRCSRCRTKRSEGSTSGYIQTRSYDHPDGYLHKGRGAMTKEGRAILRLASQMRGNVIYVDDEGNPVKPPKGAARG